jgi:type VI secretion system protein VasD
MMDASLDTRSLGRRAVLAGLAGSVVSACAIDRAPKTTDLRFIVEADALINPNDASVASPVVLRIYELKQVTAFRSASLFELLDNDSTVLGQDLVAKREIEIKPGETLKFDRSTPVETHAIGVIAGFRTIETAKWRADLEIQPEKGALVTVKVTAQTVSIETRVDKTLGFF